VDGQSLTFLSAIQGQLEIKFKDSSYEVPAGNFKDISITLKPWGFEGSVVFLVMSDQQEDKLLKPFSSEDSISIALTLETAFPSTQGKESKPLKLVGMVSHRSYQEQTEMLASDGGNPVVLRYYSLSFQDPAAACWRQHYPLKLYTESDLKTALQEHTTTDIALKMDWDDVLGKKLPQVMLPTANCGSGSASFYDFVCWLVQTNSGFFYYDYANPGYVISDQRKDPSDPLKLQRIPIGGYSVQFSPMDYAKPNYLNGVAKDPSTQEGENELAITPLVSSYLTLKETPAEFDTFVSNKKKSFIQPQPDVHWSFTSLPDTWPLPGDLLECSLETWSQEVYPAGKKFRVWELELKATTAHQSARPSYGDAYEQFVTSFELKGEPVESKRPRYPEFTAPHYPVRVEGLVFSDKGDDKAQTYAFLEDDDNKQRYYQVQIPLWDKQKIRVPYQPRELNGQFYFPPYKNQRVLVDIFLTHSVISSHLDWREYSTLPMDGQGNHIVLGQTDKSLTSIKHDYTDNKPQLEILRTLEKDTETIVIGEGFIRLITKEEK
jgi:hypothetical protein